MATIRKTLTAVGTTLTVLVLLATTAAAQMPQTTTDKAKGAPSVTTQELTGEVVHVEGNDLVVQMSGGELRIFHTPASRRFIVDGKELHRPPVEAGNPAHRNGDHHHHPRHDQDHDRGKRQGVVRVGQERHPHAAER